MDFIADWIAHSIGVCVLRLLSGGRFKGESGYAQGLYEVEREVRELEPGFRQRIRQEKAAPIIDALHT